MKHTSAVAQPSLKEKGLRSERGGTTLLVRRLRKCEKYQEWIKQVFLRDRFTCQHCGARNGRKRVIEADHIISFAKLLRQHNITTFEQAQETPILWDVSNGRTLCHSCHQKTESYPQNFVRKATKK